MKWTRTRVASALAAGTATALLLSACNGTDADPTQPPSDTEGAPAEVSLTVAQGGSSGLEPLIADYMELNPHVSIELITDELGAHHDALQQHLITGADAAEVTVIDAEYIAGFVAQADDFVNLLDMGAERYEENYLEWQWADAATADGAEVIGLGSNLGGLALCYRRDLFEEAGLPVGRDGVNEAIGDTWEGFIALGQEYTVATDRPFVDNATNLNAPVLAQDSTGYYTRDHELNMEPTKRAFDVALDAIAADLSANKATWSDEWNASFENGDFAALACPSWMLGHIQSQASSDNFEGQWDVADLPGPGGNWGGSWYTIPDQFDSNVTEEAYALIEWLIDAEQQMALFQENGTLPAHQGIHDEPEIEGFTNSFFNDAPVGQIFTDSAAEIPGTVYDAPKHDAVRRAVENVLNEVQAGNIAMEDAWDQAVSAAEAVDAA